MPLQLNRHVIVIDDNPAIHDDFRKVLGIGMLDKHADLHAKEAALFGDVAPVNSSATFDVDTALQGQDGIERPCNEYCVNQGKVILPYFPKSRRLTHGHGSVEQGRRSGEGDCGPGDDVG